MPFVSPSAPCATGRVSIAASTALCHRAPTHRLRRAGRSRMCAAAARSAPPKTTLASFVTAARNLGTLRFIAVTPGAVLETVGRFDYSQTTFATPKGNYLTIASVDKTFECHVNLAKASVVSLSTEPAKIGTHDLHVIRVKDPDGAILLSCLLMWDPSQGPGHYLADAVSEFQQLRRSYGDVVTLHSE